MKLTEFTLVVDLLLRKLSLIVNVRAILSSPAKPRGISSESVRWSNCEC